MDIRELQYFVQVADLGNYSLAAEQLYISQPALSKVVQKLETELGYDLFYTDRRLQKLTPEGRELYRKSLRVIWEFEEIGNLAKSASEQKIGLEGQIYLGFPPAGGSAYFCELIAGFTRRYPEIRISIKEESSYQIMADIDAGMLDVGCALEPVPEGKYESTFFARDASRLVVSSWHRLAGKRSVCLKDLEGEPFFLLGSDYVIFNSLRDACRREGFEPNVAQTLAQWDYIIQMVRLDQGVTFLPDSLLQHYHIPGVSVLDVEGFSVAEDLFLITGRDSYHSRRVDLLIDYAVRFMGRTEGEA